MVHALQEAQRVLKPDGILVDLRPAHAHRQIGLGAGRAWQPVAALHERLDADYAADAAVTEAVRRGLFRRELRKRFLLDRVMDSPEELHEFIADLDQAPGRDLQAALMERLRRRYARQPNPSKVAVRGPMHLGVLRKLPAAPRRPAGGGMILAILPDASAAERLLNNLSEAEFHLQDISVILQDVGTRDKIAGDAGPLKGVQPAQLVSQLKAAGVAESVARRCREALRSGKALVAMQVAPRYEPAAREMFEDASAEIL